MLTSLLGFVLICLNCLRVGCQLNTSSNMGAYFLVQAPHAQGGNVKLILYTMVSDPIDIIVSVPGFPEVYEKLVNIHRPRLGSADLPEYFTTDQPGFIWTAVARSTDGSLFGVAVYIPNKEDAIAIMVAAPVISFGDLYYIVTLGNGSFFSVLAPNNMTEVTIDVINPSREFKVGVNNQTFSHGTQNSFYLLEEQAFILQVPGCNEISKGGLTGTRVSADKPVGVITGNCRTKTSNITCGDSEDFSDMTLEMMVSVESYGKMFIIFDIDILSAGYVVIVAAVANTTVMIHHYDLDDEPMTLVLEEPGNFVEERGPDRNSRLLKANFPVACYYVGVSPCMGKDRGGPFLTAVVPNELQLNAYLLRFPKSQRFKFDVWVLIVCRKYFIHNIRLNGETLPNHVKWVVVSGLPDWRVGHLYHNSSRLDSYSSNGMNYGMYAYGIQLGHAFMSPVGYLVSPINSPCQSSINESKPGDLIDNDCDGYIDEELSNYIDDDQDGLTDEDLTLAPRVRGNWGPWTRWTCPRKCQLQRRFLIDCVGKCPHCETDCHKYTGVCYKCLAGWRFPAQGCNESCPPMTFGYECKGHCEIKCGADCMERVHGFCPDLSSGKDALFLLLYVIMFLPFMCFPCVLHLNIPCIPGRAPHKKKQKHPNGFTAADVLKKKNLGSDTSLGKLSLKFTRKGMASSGSSSCETLF